LRSPKTIFVIFMAAILASCAETAMKGSSGLTGYRETGKASYYAAKYQNQQTASGERLDNKSYTAAHKNLPFGTKVKVTNIENGKSVVVEINDRGPFVKGRIIDLTRSAFRKIGDLNAGIISVQIEVVDLN